MSSILLKIKTFFTTMDKAKLKKVGIIAGVVIIIIQSFMLFLLFKSPKFRDVYFGKDEENTKNLEDDDLSRTLDDIVKTITE